MNDQPNNSDQLGKAQAQAEIEKLIAEESRRLRHREYLGKMISICLAGFYLLYALIFICESKLALLELAAGLALPLACIWFGEALGNYRGFFGGGIVTHKSHPSIIRLIGWLILLLPLFIGIIALLRGGKACIAPE
jgi:hypothetical protein